MKIPTYVFIICFLLLVSIAFFVHYHNNNALSAKNGQLYLTTHRNIESFQNYVPDDLSTTENWNDFCVNSKEDCTNKDMTKESLKTVLDEFKQFIEVNDLDALKTQLVGPDSPQWEFVTKQKIYNITHSHNTVGELIYHLKNLDFNIFIQLFNKIGYEEAIVENLYDKVNEIKFKKEYLDIKDGDVIAMKIKMVHSILKKIKEAYVAFQASDNFFEFSDTTTFNTIEKCKIVKQSSPYSEYSEDVFANKTLGCPRGHYLKGMSYNVDDTTFTQNFHCCELNASDLKQGSDSYSIATSVINNITPDDAILSDFSFDINETSDLLGNYEQTNINSNVSSDSIKLTGYDNFAYESKIYWVFIHKPNNIINSAEANAIISELNKKSSLKFIIPEQNILPSGVSIDKTGYVKKNNLNVPIHLSTIGTTSTTEIGIFAIVYGEKNHIKYIIDHSYGENIKLDTEIIQEVDTQEAKSILNVENYESKIINFNGIYNKQQNSFTNINNPLIVMNYNSKLNYWTLEYNKVPIIYYADIPTTTLSPMMKEVFDISQLTEPKYYYNGDITSGDIDLNDGGEDVKKLLNISIIGNTDYSGDYIFKQLSNNRPEYTKQNNELITIKWNNAPDIRRWQINLSNQPIFTNNTNSISVPSGTWTDNDSIDINIAINSVNTDLGLKDYIFLTKSGNFIKPKVDILTKKFMLEDSQIAYNKSQTVQNMYVFNIIKEIDNYYIKNKQSNLFINVTNEGKIILSNNVNKKPLNLIKQNNRYLIRLPNENKLATLENLVLKMKPSFNIMNPEDNQLFEIVNISEEQQFPVKANYSYYEDTTSTSTTPSSISLTIPEKMSGFNEKEIICKNNEYVSQLLKTDNEIELKCKKILTENSLVTSKRIEFFKTSISDFSHSHDFIVEDPIHNIPIEDTGNSLLELNNFKSKLLGTQVELYSKRDTEYLNQSQLYSPLQKILIMMVMMKLNNIDSVNLDTNSLFEYFSKQNIFDIYYTELLSPTTSGPTTTTTSGPTTTTTSGPTTTTTSGTTINLSEILETI